MARAIYEYQLEIQNFQQLAMSRGAKILGVGLRVGPTLWAMVDPAEPVETRGIWVRRTGQPIAEDLRDKYVGTIPLRDRVSVLHVFAD